MSEAKIPRAVKMLRAATGMSQQRFANSLGMSLNAIARYEAGRCPDTGVAMQLLRRSVLLGQSEISAILTSYLLERNPALGEVVDALSNP